MRLLHNRNGDHCIGQARPQNGHQRQRQQQAGKGQDDVHDAHDDGVERPTYEAGDQSDGNPNDQRQRNHDAADEQREPAAVNDAREHVAADRVGAQNEPPVAALLPHRRHQ